MATSRETISGWFDRCKAVGDAYMIVACDTVKHEYYPVGASNADECRQIFNEVNQADMARVVEVYDLIADKETQLAEDHCMRLPI